MNDLKKIVWLASYPKSGNTWFRIFLTNFLRDGDNPANINELHRTPIASSRSMFDEYSGLPSSDLTPDEIDHLRPALYRQIARETKETIYHKVHDAYRILPDGNPLFPAEITKAVIYFIRNPLDVAISFAHHSATTIDRMIRAMNNPDYAFCKREDRLHNQLEQKLFAWSGHVESWTRQQTMPVLIIRYEDMLKNTFENFKKAINFVGLKADDEKIKQAVYFSRLEELQKQEQEKGFREKSPKANSFFRKGYAGDWKTGLTKEQVNQLVEHHKGIMQKYGYWPVKHE